MVPMIIDLTSSPEPEPEPKKVTKQAALKSKTRTRPPTIANGHVSAFSQDVVKGPAPAIPARYDFPSIKVEESATHDTIHEPRSHSTEQPPESDHSAERLSGCTRTSNQCLNTTEPPSSADGGIIVLDVEQSDISSPMAMRQDGCQRSGRSTPSSSPSHEMPPRKRQRVTDTTAQPTLASMFGYDRSESEQSTPPTANTLQSRKGLPYSEEEDALLRMLKGEQHMRWSEMVDFFQGRSAESLQVRYSYISRRRPPEPSRNIHSDTPPREDSRTRAPRRRRGGGPSAVDGFVSWAQVAEWRSGRAHIEAEPSSESARETERSAPPLTQRDRIFPTTLTQSLRNRELGRTHARSLIWHRQSVPDELRNNTLRKYSLRKKFDDASGDISCLTWSVDKRGQGKRLRFAAGSVAVSDSSSMQYNRPYNLLLGDYQDGTLQELANHHIRRPVISSSENLNPNSLETMRNTQDERLFMTVDAVHFSPGGETLYSGGGDGALRAYRFDGEHQAHCVASVEHGVPVTHVSVNADGLVASASRQAQQSVQTHIFKDNNFVDNITFNPRQRTSAVPIAPSALRWGSAYTNRNYLLAGYTSFNHYADDEGLSSGDVCLWEAETGQSIELAHIGRNVFDLAWNPMPRAGSTLFAVAGTALHLGRKTRSTVQCFAGSSGRIREVIEWQCPALDINDVIYCPHDDNLIAAGATDGKVYVWDARFAERNQRPLHILCHGDSLNVLDHNLDRETADTGVRFLSWGATSSRLYSGSSDGVVKVWNPYHSADNAHIDDVATFQAGIMSGSFSPDYCDLLIGEERGHLNLLTSVPPTNNEEDIDEDDGDSRDTERARFDIISAPCPIVDGLTIQHAAQELLDSKQIEIRPMGDFPVRQAVQGPAYAGPYLRPSISEWAHSREALHSAQLHLDELDRKVVDDDDEASHKTARQQSQKAVQAALDAIERLKIRHEDYDELLPQAEALQRSLRNSEPQSTDVGDPHRTQNQDIYTRQQPTDSLDSEHRIPGTIIARRAAPYRHGLYNLDCSGLYALGLARRCMVCQAAASATNPRIKQWLAMKCSTRSVALRAGLSTRCAECNVPVMTTADDDKISTSGQDRRCHRCRFACFRCSNAVGWSSDSSRIICYVCRLEWEVGVLGYDLVGKGTCEGHQSIPNECLDDGPDETSAEDDDAGVEIGDDEIEHYHSRWLININDITTGKRDDVVA